MELARPALTPVVLLKLDREFFSGKISDLWRSTAESILEVGRTLIQAKEMLPHGSFTEMVQIDLPFGDRAAQMLMKVASNPVLSNPKHASLLPPSWMTLHELSKVDGVTLEQAFTEGKITPSLERHQVPRLFADGHERVRDYPFDCPGCGSDKLRRLRGAPKPTDGYYYVEVHECLGECKKLWLCGSQVIGETHNRYV